MGTATRRPLKIAATGAHGTGKTTLVVALSEALKAHGWQVEVLPEVPREVCEAVGDQTFFRRGKNSLVKQMVLLVGQAVTELNVDDCDLILCDRTIVDHWAYTTNSFSRQLDQERVTAPLEGFITTHMGTYDLVFFVPPEIPPKDDGVREDDSDFQRTISDSIEGLLRATGVSSVRLTGSVEARVDEALNHLIPLRRG